MIWRGQTDFSNVIFCVDREPEPPIVDTASSETELRIIVGILSSFIFIGIISLIIWWAYHRWFKNRKPKQNQTNESQAIDLHHTYQPLDFSKMNTEDNYQSLTNSNPQLNNIEQQTTEIETTYEDLDVTKMNTEDNYQSLNMGASSPDAESYRVRGQRSVNSCTLCMEFTPTLKYF